MVKVWRDIFGGNRIAAAGAAGGWRGTAADWPEALNNPAGEGQPASGWWIAAAVPFGLAAWSALGWLLFAG